MTEHRAIFQNGVRLLALSFLFACGNPVNPPPPKWTSENANAPAPAKVAAPTPPPSAPKPAPAGSSLQALKTGQAPAQSQMKDITFNFDSAVLSDDARANLRTNAEWLKANASARIQIEGHCDERGEANYNMALGAKRAQAALDYLATLGIAANRMSTISYGEEIPVCKEKTEECWAKNRRARFVVAASK